MGTHFQTKIEGGLFEGEENRYKMLVQNLCLENAEGAEGALFLVPESQWGKLGKWAKAVCQILLPVPISIHA